jgi:hypothetical protein
LQKWRVEKCGAVIPLCLHRKKPVKGVTFAENSKITPLTGK